MPLSTVSSMQVFFCSQIEAAGGPQVFVSMNTPPA
jgi:hypothetical protein